MKYNLARIPGCNYRFEIFPGEDLRDIEGHPRYKVSNLGRVFSFIGRTKLRRHVVGKDGYCRIVMDGKTLYLHIIVARAFIGNPPEGTEVNHIDGDKLNCKSANLEYLTRSANLKESYRIGYGRTEKRIKAWEAIKTKVISLDPITGEITTFKSLKEASLSLGIPHASGNLCRAKDKHCCLYGRFWFSSEQKAKNYWEESRKING